MTTLSSVLLQECKAIVQNGSGAIKDLVNAAKKGKWTSQDTTQLVSLVQPLIQYLEGYNSVGFIVAGSVGFIVSAEEVPGVVLNTQNLTAAPYFYNFIGGDIGLSEGAEAAVGVLIAEGVPSSLSGWQVFADASATVVGGVGVQYSPEGQFFVFVATGEEVNISVGGGDTSVKQL